MSELNSEGPLAGVRVVDLTDERAIYGAKLIADLGADVVRVEPPQGDPLRKRGPHAQAFEASLYYAFFASSRRSFTVDLNSEQGRAQFRKLLDRAEIVLTSDGRYGSDQVAEINAIHINCSSFGTDGPWRDYLAPDLVAGALAGQVATTGDSDTAPLKTFGELNFMVSGVYVAIAALAALYHQREGGAAQSAEVPVHECIASCLEQVLMFYWYADTLERPEGKVLPRRGSVHWSDGLAVVNGANGSIMVTPNPDFERQLFWLVEQDAHGDLIDPKYLEPENLSERIALTMSTLQEWVKDKDVEALFLEAQERRIPYGWVQPLAKLASNPQLEARDWFVDHDLQGHQVKMPGAPYHFSETPWCCKSDCKDHADAGEHTEAILQDIGWGAEHG